MFIILQMPLALQDNFKNNFEFFNRRVILKFDLSPEGSKYIYEQF